MYYTHRRVLDSVQSDGGSVSVGTAERRTAPQQLTSAVHDCTARVQALSGSRRIHRRRGINRGAIE